MLQGSSFGLDECILYGPNNFRLEHRSFIHRSGHWFFPGLEHSFHGPSGVTIDQCVCFHVGAVEAAAKVDCVRCTHILDD